MTALRVVIGPPVPATGTQDAHLRMSFAERHVALPPELAIALARACSTGLPMTDAVWGRAFTLMARALDVSGALAGQQFLRWGMDRFLMTVAEPVLRAAARRAGVLPLPARAGSEAGATSEEEAAIIREVDLALRDPEVMGKPFWVHAALDLTMAARQNARARIRSTAQPPPLSAELDPALVALVFLHPPEFDADAARRPIRRKARQAAALRRSGIRPKEGGVAGIIPSRQLDDLPDALMSELILPQALFTNKLLHDGLLVRHRPPRREPRRDLLAVMLHQPNPSDGMGLLVQAAWADAAIRLRVALFQLGLANSDLVWSGPGTALHLDCTPDLPGLEHLPPLKISGKARADMLLRSGLYPEHALLPRSTPAGSEQIPLEAALRAGLLKLARAHRRPGATIAQDYARRFLLVTGPRADRRGFDPAELRASHLSATARGFGAAHWAALSWTDAGGKMPVLTGYADRRAPVTFTLPDDQGADSAALHQFMGALVMWIMDVTLEALDANHG